MHDTTKVILRTGQRRALKTGEDGKCYSVMRAGAVFESRDEVVAWKPDLAVAALYIVSIFTTLNIPQKYSSPLR